MNRPIHIVRIAPDFEKSYSALHKNVRILAARKDQWFRTDAFDARLKTHKLKGHLEGYWSWSVNRDYRVLFRFLGTHEVIYYDIGTHDIYR